MCALVTGVQTCALPICAKAIRMVYSDAAGERVRNEDTPAALRQRFSIDDDDVQELARQALTIEEHYGRPMDIEWAKDGVSGKQIGRASWRDRGGLYG